MPLMFDDVLVGNGLGNVAQKNAHFSLKNYNPATTGTLFQSQNWTLKQSKMARVKVNQGLQNVLKGSLKQILFLSNCIKAFSSFAVWPHHE